LQLIGAAQRVEHYEVAAYGSARAMTEKSWVSPKLPNYSEKPSSKKNKLTQN
jgi:hypothetical protein